MAAGVRARRGDQRPGGRRAFSENATCMETPFDEPARGRDAISENWARVTAGTPNGFDGSATTKFALERRRVAFGNGVAS